MRIAIIVHTFPSLSETFIFNKVVELSARGHRLIVFCSGTSDDVFPESANELKNVKIILLSKKRLIAFIAVHPLLLLSSLKGLKQARQNIFRKFRVSLINKYNPDIIHFEFSGIGIDYLSDLGHFKGKTVVSCRGSAEKVKLLVSSERGKKFSMLLDKIDAVHCVSVDMKKTIEPYCSREEKIFINYPSINTRFFKRIRPSVHKDRRIILSVGRLTFQKGHFAGLLAVKILKEAGIPFHWIIVGNGIKYEELVFKTHQLGLQQEVKLLGFASKDEVKQLMEDASIFFLPSLYEGVANVVLEAMSMELPVVSTKSGGMAEVITHDIDGLLTEIYDYEDMALQLKRLLTDVDLYNRIAVNGRKKVEMQFFIERQIDCYEKVYSALANNAQHEIKPASIELQ